MNDNLLGQYDLSRVTIDCNSSYANFTVYAHELAHYSLTKNTLFGITHFLSRQTDESTPNTNLSRIVSTLTDASERTQETYSMYYEILHVSSQYKRFFKSWLFSFKQGAYYTKYQFRDFEWCMGIEGLNNDAKLIDRLATIAMNVDITKSPDNNPWESSKVLFGVIIKNKSCYMPDFRLEKLLLLINTTTITKLHEMTDHEIAAAAGIEYLDFTTETVLGLLKRLCRQFEISGYSTGLVYANIENIETNQIELGYYLPKDANFSSMLKQTILPECLNQKFTLTPLTTLPNKDVYEIDVITLYDENKLVEMIQASEDTEALDPQGQEAFIRLIEDFHRHGKKVCLSEFTDIEKKRKYSVITDSAAVSDYLHGYRNIIQFYFDDYKAVLQNWPLLSDRRVFFILKNPYYEFKNLIADYISARRHAFIYKLNDGVFFLFVLDGSNNVFYTYQSMINLDVVIADFENGFFCSPDDVLLTEKDQWHGYAQIMSHISETNVINTTLEEFGNRRLDKLDDEITRRLDNKDENS